jgi:hypothetical protein
MWLAGVRDVAIVLLALESVVIGILLAATLVQIRKLIKLLREEIAPMMHTAQDTLHTVKGTTDFVSQSVVEPLIKVTSYSAGTMQALRSLFFIGRKIRKRSAGEPGEGASGER